jgi:hypothetical protein
MRKMVLRLTDEEHAVLSAFLSRGYEQFMDYTDHVLAIRGDGGEVYAEDQYGTLCEPPACAVIAAALNGLVRSGGTARVASRERGIARDPLSDRKGRR